VTAPGAEAGFTVPPAHPSLPGHFPGRPLVPAVVLIDLATEAARQAFALGPLIAITRGKFQAPVRPGEAVALRFTRRGDVTIGIAGLRDGVPAFSIDAEFAPGSRV
jgi:3-hydroxymyristoyl/3-hydroxydecanoyl-(acyl carrier protein) dehydratase